MSGEGFTKDELKKVLPDLAVALRDLLKVTPEKFNACGTDEKRINGVIEAEQRRVFVKHGFDGDNGLQNLRRVARGFKNDAEIMRPFMAMVQFEELTVTLVVARNGGKKPSPQQISKMMANIQTLSQAPTTQTAATTTAATTASATTTTAATTATTTTATNAVDAPAVAAAAAAAVVNDVDKPTQNKMEK